MCMQYTHLAVHLFFWTKYIINMVTSCVVKNKNPEIHVIIQINKCKLYCTCISKFYLFTMQYVLIRPQLLCTSFVHGSAHPIFLTCVTYFSEKCMPDHEGFRIDKQEGHRP